MQSVTNTVLRLLHYTDLIFLPVRRFKNEIRFSCQVSFDLSLPSLHLRSTSVYNGAVCKQKRVQQLAPKVFCLTAEKSN